jgi:hypothetical protein
MLVRPLGLEKSCAHWLIPPCVDFFPPDLRYQVLPNLIFVAQRLVFLLKIDPVTAKQTVDCLNCEDSLNDKMIEDVNVYHTQKDEVDSHQLYLD